MKKRKPEELEYIWPKAGSAMDTIYLSKLINQTSPGISADGVTTRHQSLLAMYTSIAKRQKEVYLLIHLYLKKCKSISLRPPWSLLWLTLMEKIKETLLRGKRSFTMPGPGGESNGRLFLPGGTRLGQ